MKLTRRDKAAIKPKLVETLLKPFRSIKDRVSGLVQRLVRGFNIGNPCFDYVIWGDAAVNSGSNPMKAVYKFKATAYFHKNERCGDIIMFFEKGCTCPESLFSVRQLCSFCRFVEYTMKNHSIDEINSVVGKSKVRPLYLDKFPTAITPIKEGSVDV